MITPGFRQYPGAEQQAAAQTDPFVPKFYKLRPSNVCDFSHNYPNLISDICRILALIFHKTKKIFVFY